MPSQLAGESESVIDSAWPREERTYFSSSCGGNGEKKKRGEKKKKIAVFHPGHVYVCTSHVWCHSGTINPQRKHKTNDVGENSINNKECVQAEAAHPMEISVTFVGGRL